MFDVQRALPRDRAGPRVPVARRLRRSYADRVDRHPSEPSRCTRSRPCRATTTCSPPTSSTTAAGCGSSTTSTPATTTPASSWATSGARRPCRCDLLDDARRRLLRPAVGAPRSPGRGCWRPDQQVRLDALGLDPGRQQHDRLRLLVLGDGEVRTGGGRVRGPRPRAARWRRSCPPTTDCATTADPPEPSRGTGKTRARVSRQAVRRRHTFDQGTPGGGSITLGSSRRRGHLVAEITKLTDDEQQLAELGYKQELHRSLVRLLRTSRSRSRSSRSWPAASPPSAPAGTTAARSRSRGLADPRRLHPDHRLLHVRAGVGVPDLGRHLLVGLQAGWRPRRLLHRLAEPDRPGRAHRVGRLRRGTFLDLTISTLFSDSYATDFLGGDCLHQQFFIFVVVLVLVRRAEHLQPHLLAIINNISVWWHVVGAAIVVLILIFVPDHAPERLSFVFTERFNNSGFGDGTTRRPRSGSTCCRSGFLLTQYTITGFDASAHLSEETQSRGRRRGQGHLAVDLLLRDRRLDPAARVPVRRQRPRRGQPDGRGQRTAGSPSPASSRPRWRRRCSRSS